MLLLIFPRWHSCDVSRSGVAYNKAQDEEKVKLRAGLSNARARTGVDKTRVRTGVEKAQARIGVSYARARIGVSYAQARIGVSYARVLSPAMHVVSFLRLKEQATMTKFTEKNSMVNIIKSVC